MSRYYTELDLWRDVAVEVKSEWMSAYNALEGLEAAIQADRVRRLKYYRLFRLGGYLMQGAQNVFTGITTFLAATSDSIPMAVVTVSSAIAFVHSLTLWSQLNKKAERVLSQAKDLDQIIVISRHFKDGLRRVIEDGVITTDERTYIREALTKINVISSEIGNLNIVMQLLGENGNKKTAGYLQAVTEMDQLFCQVSVGGDKVRQRAGLALHEDQSIKLFSSGVPSIG